MSEDDHSSVDVVLGEVSEARRIIGANHHDVSVERTTEQCEDDVLRRSVVIVSQQLLTRYCTR